MSARKEIHRLESRIDAAMVRAKAIADLETQSDAARYLCVLVSGLVERTLEVVLTDYVTRTSAPAVQSFVLGKLKRITNVKASKLLIWLESFDSNWGDAMRLFLDDERRDALDSIVANRHLIAHGRSSGITLIRVERFYQRVKLVNAEMVRITGAS